MWISKEELQELVEKKAKDLCISNRIELITKERELSKKYIQRLEHEKNELSKYRVKVVSINSELRAELNELKEENDKFKKANDSLYKRVSDLSHERDNLERQIEMLEDDKKELQELYVATRKVQESLIPKCQKLHSENEVLIKENEELKNKELKDTEKICDGVNEELLNLCTKITHENLLLIHKESEQKDKLAEENKQLKEENEYLKRVLHIRKISIKTSTVADMTKKQNECFKCNRFGIISKALPNTDRCGKCVYGKNINTSVCDYCLSTNNIDEYYSSK